MLKKIAVELKETAKVYATRLKYLLEGLARRRRSAGADDVDNEAREARTIHNRRFRDGIEVTQVEQEAGEDSDDYPVSEQMVKDARPLSKTKPTLKRVMSDLVHTRNINSVVRSDFLCLHHYSVLYWVLNERSEDNHPDTDAIISFLFTLVHTGMAPKVLINLTIGARQTPTERIPVLSLIGKRYYIETPLLVRGKNFKKWDDCPQSRGNVLIPLPDKICRLIEKLTLPKTGFAFSFINSNGERQKVDLYDVRKFLNATINKSPIFSPFDLRITVYRIARSFDPLYVTRYGMDPVIATIVRADKEQHLFRSQAHYVFIPRREFEAHYIDRYKSVDSAILANMQVCIKKQMIPSTTNPSIILDTDQTELDIDEANEEGYGSSIIPPESYINDIVLILSNSVLAAKDDPIKRYNLLTVLVYLALQFCVGLRPHNEPDLYWTDYSHDIGLIIIRDKESSHYHEERLLFLPPVMQSLLATLRRATDWTRLFISTDISKRIQPVANDSMFLFFTEDGSEEEFRISTMKKHLKSIGIDYALRPNMPRHFLRNMLYHGYTGVGHADVSNAGTSNDAIDPILGHAHGGREVMNLYGSSMLADASKYCLPLIISMIERLGFRESNLYK